MRQFRDWRGRLSTSDFTVSHDRIFLRNPTITLASADALLGLFAFVARHGVLLSWDTQRKVQAASPQLEAAFRANPPRYAVWRELMSQPHAAAGLRQMQETGLLAMALPQWHAIESLVVRDFYHRYTVDEHTLVAIETIDGLYGAKSDAASRFGQLALEYENAWLLRLALLLHDIGKGTTPGDHVRGSLDVADELLPALSLPIEDRQTIRFLIEHHLDLSSVMNGRDLNDPATARFLTGRLGTQENLKALVLFTYADISAVNPTALTPWRAEQLWRVYTLTDEQLTRELSSDRIHSVSSSPCPLAMARTSTVFSKVSRAAICASTPASTSNVTSIWNRGASGTVLPLKSRVSRALTASPWSPPTNPDSLLLSAAHWLVTEWIF